MRFSQRFFRYLVVGVASLWLMIGIKACASPTTQQTSTESQPAATSTEVASNPIGAKKININTAILSELDKLEAQLAVPALSHKIQASRPYGSPEELVSKNVVSQAQFDQIKDQLTIEEIVLTGEAKDIDYMTKLGLMKGHMIVAGELLALQKPEQAEPHLGHPVEEIYVDLEEQLSERNVTPFKDVLTRVQDLVKSKPNDPQIKTEYEAAMTAIDQAIAALPEPQRSNPKFVLPVINGMLETATAEYTAAITNGQVKEAIEYQDSRGFVAYAQDELYKSIEPQITKADTTAHDQMTAAFKQLRSAWPEPIPPTTPVMTPDQVAASVKQIEQAGTPVLKASAS